jgi:hypothetical protein
MTTIDACKNNCPSREFIVEEATQWRGRLCLTQHGYHGERYELFCTHAGAEITRIRCAECKAEYTAAEFARLHWERE